MAGITKFCPRIMSNFSVLDQQQSDSNSIELSVKQYFFPMPNQDMSFFIVSNQVSLTYE